MSEHQLSPSVPPQNSQGWQRWIGIGMFVAVSFGLAWLVALPLWTLFPNTGLANLATNTGSPDHEMNADLMIRTLVVHATAIIMMATPLIAALLTLILWHRVPFRACFPVLGFTAPVLPRLSLTVDLRVRKPVRSIVLKSLLGMGLTILLVACTVPVAVVLGGLRLDLTNFSGLQQSMDAVSEVPLELIVIAQLLLIPIAAVVPNGIFALGEEAGWRGYLVPALWDKGLAVTLLASGILWGLWHAPLVLLGWNFNEPNVWGLLLMVVGCTVFGAVCTWLRVWSGSIWPPTVAHGAFNASAGIGVLLSSAEAEVNVIIANALGIAGWIVGIPCAAILWLLWRRNHRH